MKNLKSNLKQIKEKRKEEEKVLAKSIMNFWRFPLLLLSLFAVDGDAFTYEINTYISDVKDGVDAR
jgi:hypothetical protein